VLIFFKGELQRFGKERPSSNRPQAKRQVWNENSICGMKFQSLNSYSKCDRQVEETGMTRP